MTTRQARKQGAKARRAGKSRDDCPYPTPSILAAAWKAGWQRAGN